jgi:hypothetical protein
VREQIRKPDELILSRYCMMTPASRSDRVVSFVEEPLEWASVIVQASNAAVILPSDTKPGIYERLAAIEPWPPGEQTFSGKTAPWPTGPVYALDRFWVDRIAADGD